MTGLSNAMLLHKVRARSFRLRGRPCDWSHAAETMFRIFTRNLWYAALTPELSRAAERPRQSDNLTTLCRGREADSA